MNSSSKLKNRIGTYGRWWFLVGVITSVTMSLTVFSSGRITADEGSYLFQAHAFLDGMVRRHAPGLEPFLQFDMIILNGEDGWLSRYPPGHSLWLMPGTALGWPQMMTALACGLTLLISTRVGRLLDIPTWYLPLFLILSPFFLLMHGTLLSHTSGLLAAMAMWWLYLRGRKEQSWWILALSGLCWSFLFLNRTWTALLIAVPFGIDSLWCLWNGRTSVSVWKQTVAFGATAFLGGLLYLGYNAVTTGDPGLATYLLYEPSENLGFGMRRLQGGARYTVNHTFTRGLGFFGDNLIGLDRWLYGIPVPGVTLISLGVLAWIGFKRRVSLLALGVILMVPAGYVAFWFPGVPDVGPLYMTEVLPFLLTLIGLGVWKIRFIWDKRGLGKGPAIGLLVLVALCSGALIGRESRTIQATHGPGWEAEAGLRAQPGRHLVLIDPSLNRQRRLRHYISLNRRGLDSRILRFQVTSSAFPELCAAFPDRTPWIYRLNADGPELRSYTAPDTLGPWSKEGSRGRQSDELLFYGWYPLLPAGEYHCRFRFQSPETTGEERFDVELMAEFGKRVLDRRTIQSGVEEVTLFFALDGLQMVEPRVTRPADSTLQLLEIEITRLESE